MLLFKVKYNEYNKYSDMTVHLAISSLLNSEKIVLNQ